MRQYRNRIILGVILALVMYIGVLLVFDNQGQLTEGVLSALSSFPAWLLIPLIGTQLAVAFSRFMVWQYYLGVIDARAKISRTDSAILFTSGFVLVMSPGKAAELLKAVLLKLKTGVPITRSAPIIVAERVVDGIAVLLILTAALLLMGDQLALGAYASLSRGLVFSSTGLLTFGLVATQIEPLAQFALRLLRGLPLVGRLYTPLLEFYLSSREIFRLDILLPAVLRGVGVYLFSSVGFVLILWGFGLALTPTLILQAVFINGVTAAIGALSFIPNGAGITEISTAAMLTAIIAPANPLLTVGVAAAAALLQGFFHKWFRVLLGLGV
ncbi:MAG: flippase-like domain-containing protein, partial [Armatimonadetes bacterium]|nr:flippase-like domain-containing protein [Anaerolineae bacterium]